MKYIVTSVILFSAYVLMGQCDLDRHNTSLSSTWMSCEISTNPNPLRGESHWVSYDLGEIKKMGASHFWNINNPEELESGARQIAISVSTDGIDWDELGIWEAAIADGSGFYSGETGYDFGGVASRYILLTILNSHGGTCVGFGEIRVDLDAPSFVSETEDYSQDILAYPNPATEITTVTFKSKAGGEGLLQLTDLSGRSIMQREITLESGEQSIVLPLQEVPNGQYLIRIISGVSELQTELTIIQH